MNMYKNETAIDFLKCESVYILFLLILPVALRLHPALISVGQIFSRFSARLCVIVNIVAADREQELFARIRGVRIISERGEFFVESVAAQHRRCEAPMGVSIGGGTQNLCTSCNLFATMHQML